MKLSGASQVRARQGLDCGEAEGCRQTFFCPASPIKTEQGLNECWLKEAPNCSAVLASELRFCLILQTYHSNGFHDPLPVLGHDHFIQFTHPLPHLAGISTHLLHAAPVLGQTMSYPTPPPLLFLSATEPVCV